MPDTDLPIHKAIWDAATPADLDLLAKEAGERVKAALLDFDGPGEDWEASAALDGALSQYQRLGIPWWTAAKRLKSVSDEAGIEAAGEQRLQEANRRALREMREGRGR